MPSAGGDEAAAANQGRLLPKLAAYAASAQQERRHIGEERRRELRRLSSWISRRIDDGEAARLTYICTHNSRRSHMAQVWAQTAAHLYGIKEVETYSGGTEATAFNPRAVAALERAGFAMERTGKGANPVTVVRFSEDVEPLECFSKVHDQPPNPTAGFCAVMTCAAADAACPAVLGASGRFAIPYDDPKEFDGTSLEGEKYDERCRQIAREMLFAFSLVAAS